MCVYIAVHLFRPYAILVIAQSCMLSWLQDILKVIKTLHATANKYMHGQSTGRANLGFSVLCVFT